MSITIQGQGRTAAPAPLSATKAADSFADALRAGRETASQPSGREAVQRRPRDPQTPFTGLTAVPAQQPLEKSISFGVSSLGHRLPGPLVRIYADPPPARLIAAPCPTAGRF